MASVLDYSKWDNLEVSDDEEEQDSWKPQVHRLDKPTSVTFGGPGDASDTGVEFEYVDSSEPASSSASSASSAISAPTTTATSTTSTTTTDPLVDKRITNGASADTHMWSQTRSEITIRVRVPSSVRAKDVNIQVNEETSLLVSLLKETHVQGILSFPVVPVPDFLDLDWEIERDDATYIRITLQKKIVASQVIVWWNRIFKHEDPQLDVTELEGRRTEGGAAQMKKTQDVWAEAHRMFREKVAARKDTTKVEVDL